MKKETSSPIAETKLSLTQIKKTDEWKQAGKKCKSVDGSEYGHQIQNAILSGIETKFGVEASNSIIDHFGISGVRKK